MSEWEEALKEQRKDMKNKVVAGSQMPVPIEVGDPWQAALNKAAAEKTPQMLETQYATPIESPDQFQRYEPTSTVPLPPEVPYSRAFGRGDPSTWERAKMRFKGTDVEHDPALLQRLGGTVGSATAAGVSAKALLDPVGKLIQRLPGAPAQVVGKSLPYVGGYLASGAGSYYGSALPEQMTEWYEDFGILPEGTREKNLLGSEDLANVMRGELILDLGTGGVISAAKGGYRALSRLLQGSSKEMRALAGNAKEIGLPIPGAAFKKSYFSKVWTPIFARFPFWGGPLMRAGNLAGKNLVDVLNMKIMGPVVAETKIGRNLWNATQKTVESFNKRFAEKYKQVWDRADELQIRVNPKLVIDEAKDILADIAGRSPNPDELSPADAAVKDFIMKQILGKNSSMVTGRTTLREMDGLLSNLFEARTVLAHTHNVQARDLIRLRQAAIANAVSPEHLSSAFGSDATKGAAQNIAKALDNVNKEFHEEITSLFESSGALKLGKYEKGAGIRKIGEHIDTRQAIDPLATTFKTEKSPQVMRDIQKLVQKESPEAWQQFVDLRLRRAYEASVKMTTEGGVVTQKFDPEAFRANLGLDKPGSPQWEITEHMMKSQTRLTMKELNTFISAAEQIANMDVPNVFQMAQRRGMIGGVRAAVKTFLPIGAAAGAGGYAALSGLGIGAVIVKGLMTILPARAVSSLMANPQAAMPIQTVISESASHTKKVQAFIRLLRFGMEYTIEQGDMTRQEAEDFFYQAKDAFVELYGTPPKEALKKAKDVVVPRLVPQEGMVERDKFDSPPPAVPDPLQGRGSDFRSRMRPPVAPTVGPQWNPAPQMNPENMAMLEALKRVPTRERGFTPAPNMR